MLIAAARRRVKQAITVRAEEHGVSAPQLWVLVALLGSAGMSLGELAEKQRMELPGASRVVASLVARRMIRLKRDPADRRRAQLVLTAAGAALARKLQRPADEVRTAMVAGMNAAEVEALRGLLRRVIDNLEGLDQAPASAKSAAGSRA